METRGAKQKPNGLAGSRGKRTPEQDERYWARLRGEFKAMEYPNSGAYAQNPPDTSTLMRQIGEQLDTAMDATKRAEDLIANGSRPARSL